MLVLALGVLIFSQTRSAILGVVLATVVIFGVGKRFGLFMFAAAACLLVFLSAELLDSVQVFFARGQDTQMISSLSGRTVWWSAVLQKVAERPVIGFGAFSGGRFVALVGFSPQTSSVHNDFLEILAGSGAVGLMIAASLFCRTIWRAVKNALTVSAQSPEGQLAIEAAAVLAVLAVRSMFTTTVFWHPPLSFLLVLGYTTLLARQCTMVRAPEPCRRGRAVSPAYIA
jgi:O-antigen ligase